MKVFKTILFIFISLAFVLSIYLTTSKNCITINIIKSYFDFGSNHIKSCFSIGNLKNNTKLIFSNNPFLYEQSRQIYNQFIKQGGEFRYNILTNIEELPKKFKPKKHNFTEGILESNNFNHLYKDKKTNVYENKEYNTWSRSHGGNWNTKYSINKFINKSNVGSLKLIWKYSSIKNKKNWKQNIELNPIFHKNDLIVATADWKIVSLNGKSGKINWELQSIFQPGRRGMVSENDKKDYLYLPVGGRIYKIDMKNGKLEKKFGDKGSVEAPTLVAPMIYKNLLIIVTYSNKAVYVFNKNNGNFLYLIPLYDKRRNFVGGTPWGGVALDEKKGIVYITTGNPQPSLYGVNRKGTNHKSSSLIAVDINNKKILWDFQETFHDLWDYDIPAPPVLHDLIIKDKILEIVIAPTKVGNTIILERNTGIPLFNLNYKKIEYKSDIPGEVTSEYQLNIKLPEKFHEIEFTLNDISNLSLEKKDEILEKLKLSNYGYFFPPSFNKDLIIKGLHGGAEWQGLAIDPIEQAIYIPVNNLPWLLRPYMYSLENIVSKKITKLESYNIYQNKCSSCHKKNRNGLYEKHGEKRLKYIPSLVGFTLVDKKNFSINFSKKIKKFHTNLSISNIEKELLLDLFSEWDKNLYKKELIRVEANGKAWSQFLTKDDLPASNPPWGYLAKIDLISGKLIWKKNVGYKKINGNKVLIGTPNFGGAAINGSGIIFYTGTDDNYAYAIDSDNGGILWEYKMEASGSAPPIIFEEDGKQYVSFVSTGGAYHNYKNKSSTIYTFGIE
jgi:quinoprotein glucose dehydrogenase